ncbi:hypothetical protein D3C78_1199310 [compost metagenome]
MTRHALIIHNHVLQRCTQRSLNSHFQLLRNGDEFSNRTMHTVKLSFTSSFENFFNPKHKAIEIILHFFHGLVTGDLCFPLLFPLSQT